MPPGVPGFEVCVQDDLMELAVVNLAGTVKHFPAESERIKERTGSGVGEKPQDSVPRG